ncbi:MAG: hypothetical protein JNK02_15130 [Planctomycetes bacterium]|nr:hypothetical protein [Planctomycetota bacterium]
MNAAGRIASLRLEPFGGRGVATAMAPELAVLARDSDAVDAVVAHTPRVAGASTRRLEPLGFARRVEVGHEPDGPIRRPELGFGA